MDEPQPTEVVDDEPKAWVQIHIGEEKWDLAIRCTAQHFREHPETIDAINGAVSKLLTAFADGTLESHVEKS